MDMGGGPLDTGWQDSIDAWAHWITADFRLTSELFCWAPIQDRTWVSGLHDMFLHIPPDGFQDTGLEQDVIRFCQLQVGAVHPGEDIRLGVPRPMSLGKVKAKTLS